MRTLNPQIDLQKILGDQIYNALQGDILLKINAVCEGNGHEIFNMSINEGNNLKVLPNTLKDLYDICMEVKETLNFIGDVDFYVSGRSEINAFSLASTSDEFPDTIVLNSALVNLLTTDELKYVIGHEIGHLINGDTLLQTLIRFVYPDPNEEPAYIDTRSVLYVHLSELSADRFGYLACNNLDACITACYKIASGLDLQGLNVQVDGLIKEAKERVQRFFNRELDIFGNDHPVVPMRVYALHLFATAKTQKELDEGMANIINFTYAQTEEDELFAQFAAAAGLKMGKLDGKLDNCEKELILERMGEGEIFPAQLLKEIEKSGNIDEIFNKSVKEMLEKYPEDKKRMLEYYIDLALIDGALTLDEVDNIFWLSRMLEVPDSATADLLREKIRTNYVPKTLNK